MDDAALQARWLSAPGWRRPFLVGLLTLVAGLAAAAWMGLHQASVNREEAQQSLETFTRRVASNLATRLQRYEYGLRAVRGLVAASEDQRISREAFLRHSLTWTMDAEYPGARGFGLIRRVPAADEQDFVEAVRRDGQASFAVRQLQAHNGDRWVIKFIEPVERNRAALGLDVASEAGRRNAAASAMRSGLATLTAPITLVQTEKKAAGAFLLLLPIYRAGVPIETVAQREEATVGWSYAPLVIDEVLQGLDTDTDLYTLVLRDIDGANAVEFFRQQPAGIDLSRTVDIPIFGRTWQAEVSATPAFVASLHQISPGRRMLEFALLSVLCAGLAAAMTKLVDRTQAQRLEQARRAAIVEGSEDAIVVQTLDGVITDWNQGAERLFGYAAVEALGRTATDLLLPAGMEAEDASIRATVASGLRFKVLETVRRHRDGSLIEVSIAASPIRAPDGRCVGSAKTLRDIREARQAERQVRELNASLEDQVRERTASLETARRDLQTVLDAMPSQIGYWDTALHNKVANQAYKAWFGIDPARVHGMHLRDLLGPTLYADCEPRARAALAGQAQTFEESVPGPDGAGTRHALVHYLPDMVGDRARGFYVFVHDVTELTESRLRLAKAQRDNAVLLQTLHQHAIVSVADRAGRIIDVNEAFCQISGYSAQELIGQNHRLVNSGTHDKAFWQDMWRTIRSGRSWRAEVCNRAKDGSLYWVDSVVAPFMNAHGEVEQYASIRTNITDRKRTEIELQRTLALVRAMLDASTNVSIIAVEPQGTVSLFNKGAELLLGYSADEVVGHAHPVQWHDRAELRHQARALRRVEGRHVKAGMALFDEAALNETHEWTYRRKDGKRVPVAMCVTKMEDGKGALLGYLSLAQDISARRDHERSLQAATEQARRANQAKSEFLANMSHEIRTPMNAVIGLSYLLERTSLDADQADMLARLNLAGTSLLAIINDVLDLSKIEAGEMALEQAPFELPVLLRELAGLMGVQAQQKGIGYRVELDPKLPLAVVGDSTRLRQVLMNLLSNAIKFTAQGSVTLRATRVADKGGRVDVRFEVTDTGIGIDPAAQSRLFEPFVQADTSTTRRFGGTGLGLSIVRQLVDLMGGRLSLDSALGVGSVFAVALDFEACEAPLRNEAEKAPNPDERGLAGLCLLVVDDNPANQDVARRILENEGATTLIASHGQEAIDLLAQPSARIDAVIMDVQMPVLDGLDATRQIREALGLRDLPIIGLTAGVSRTEQERGREAGMNEVLGKPFDPRSLVLCLRRAIGLRIEPRDLVLPGKAQALPPGWPLVAGIDAADACVRLGGDVGLFRTLLRRLQTDALALDPALADADLAALRLHDLKGMAGTLGARDVQQWAAEAEAACREGLLPQAVALAARLRDGIHQLAVPALAAHDAGDTASAVDPGHAHDDDRLRVDALVQRLAANDLSALPLFHDLRPALRARLSTPAFEALCAGMDGLDFPAAARELAHLSW
jgi:PAS domain S-box-containing protein